jgi:hypothetical protein
MNRLAQIFKGKLWVIGVSAIIVYTLSGILLAPYLVRHYVPGIVQENFKKNATIGEVRFNPYVFIFEANDFRMDEPDGEPIAGFNRLVVDFELKSLFKWAWTFKQIAVEQPHLNTIIRRDGTLNLAQIVPASDTTPSEEKDKSLPRLIFEQLFIDQGRIDFTDKRQSEPATVIFMPLNIDIHNLTTLPEQEGSKTITAITGDGETFQWTGNIDLKPVSTRGTFKFENIHTATLWKFARDSLNLEAPEGKINITADYDFDLGAAGPKLTLDNLSVALNSVILKLVGAQVPFLEIPDMRIMGSGFDLIKQQGEINKVVVAGGAARIGVDQSGVLSLGRIVKTSGSTPPDVREPSEIKDAGTKPWKINLSSFNLEGFSLDYQDGSRSPGLKAGIDSINVDLNARVETGGVQTKVMINDIAADLSKISAGLDDTPEPEVRINNITFSDGTFDLVPNALTFGKIAVNGGKVELSRQEDGVINLALLARPPQKGLVAREFEEMETEGRSIQFLAKTIVVSGLETALSDLSVHPDGPIIHFEDISTVLNNVDGKSPMTFNLGLKVLEGGQINAEGTIDPVLPSVESEVQVSDFDMTPFQPYLNQAVFLEIKSGVVSTQGSLKYGMEEAGSQTAFDGAFKVDNLRLVEPRGTETYLGWKVLQTDQLKLRLEPDRLEIGELKLDQLVGKFIINEDKTLNITKVIKTDTNSKSVSEDPSAANSGGADLFPVVVRRLTLSDGKMEFADLSLTPQFGTKIHELKGVVAGISTKQDARAQVKLDGRVDEYGTANIDGELNTSDPKAFTNMSLVFRNVEMTKLTPYSGRFAGRKIDSGKLSVDLKYDIQKSRLAGDNQIVVERLVLGERVKSPDAANLPLDLAIALLEDSNGVIDIGLPVRGNIDSPEFSYGALIWKAFTSLITRIATSPFRALGALLPGGGEENLNNVAFEPGMPTIPPPEKEKLAKLGAALQKRPKLKLTVQGRYNPETDLAELRSISLRRKLAIRQGQESEPDMDPGPVDYGNPDTVEVLEDMFEERFGSAELKTLKEELKDAEKKAKKDKNGKSETKDPGHLGKILYSRLVDAEPVGNPELIKLAGERSQGIMEELAGPGGFPVERIEIKPSTAMTGKDQPTALLNLEVLK